MCLRKRIDKLRDIRDDCPDVDATNEKGEHTLSTSQTKMLEKLKKVIADLEGLDDKLEEIHTAGVCNGFSNEQEELLRNIIQEVKFKAVEALMMESRCRTVLPRLSLADSSMGPKAKAKTKAKAAPKVKMVQPKRAADKALSVDETPRPKKKK